VKGGTCSFGLDFHPSTVEWWGNFTSGHYWGTSYGTQSLNYYTDILADPDAAWYAKAGAGVGGFFSALWTPKTYYKTYGTFVAAAAVAGPASQMGPRLFTADGAHKGMGPHLHYGPRWPNSPHPRWHWGPRNPSRGAKNFSWSDWILKGMPWRWK
jgi:hypothetical protein